MENEKYIVTIDGTDCTGKSTLWKKANEVNKNIQIRGIVSNIAYAIKYGRSVEELIELYNQNPVNYVVYLINPINNKKLEMLYNRISNEMINDNDAISKELTDAGNTWKDYEYFEKAIEILKEKYKGKLEIIKSTNNDYDTFVDKLKLYELYDIPEDFSNPGIKALKCDIDEFEARAKIASEFKYIVFISKVNKKDIIDNLYEGLDDEHKKMFDNLIELTQETVEDVYDSLYNKTLDELVNYLEDYEIRAEVNVKCEINTYSEIYVPLRDVKDRYYLEDVIYDDYTLMDDLYDAVKDDVYNEELDISVERVR